MPLRNWRTVLLWISGGIAIFLGSMISGKLDFISGVDDLGFSFALAVSLLLFLLGGLFWISVALAIKHSKR